MEPVVPADLESEAAYLRPIVERLGAEAVHRLVDLVAAELVADDKPDPDES